MENEDVKKLITLRSLLIAEYQAIPGKNEPSSLIRARDVAIVYDQAIRKIDNILKGKVDFAEPK